MSNRGEGKSPLPTDQVPHWATATRIPRVSVRALVLEGDDVIAVENVHGPGKLHMPGGGIEHGEAMLDALTRELREELRIGPASADYLLAIENLFDTHLGQLHSIDHVFVVSPDGPPSIGEDALFLHRIPFATIGNANFYPSAFREILTRPDWRAQRFLRAGAFASHL